MNTIGEECTPGRGNKGVVFAYGHDTKKFRLRAVSAEKDAYSRFINKPVVTKLSATQIGLAVVVVFIQVVTIGLVVGRYSYYDTAANSGTGIWASFISAFAAILSGMCARNPRYWKLHAAFALHIISTLAAISMVALQFGGNIPSIRSRLGEALYGDSDYYPGRGSVPLLVTSLILNSAMASAGLVQMSCSFVMTLMTGRAICCGQSKIHGKVFELEVAGSENADGVVAVKKAMNENGSKLETAPGDGSDIPPTYQESQVV